MIIIGYDGNENFAYKFYYIKVLVKLWDILTIID